MKITLNIPDVRITDLLHGHGGGYSPWLRELTGQWTRKAGFRVKYDLEAGEEGEGKGRKSVRAGAVRRGLALMAQHEPGAFAQFLEGNDDDLTFDTALQFIIFGKLVYA